jgi:hypothetical protein
LEGFQRFLDISGGFLRFSEGVLRGVCHNRLKIITDNMMNGDMVGRDEGIGKVLMQDNGKILMQGDVRCWY